jgi:hypothetical protein
MMQRSSRARRRIERLADESLAGASTLDLRDYRRQAGRGTGKQGRSKTPCGASMPSPFLEFRKREAKSSLAQLKPLGGQDALQDVRH